MPRKWLRRKLPLDRKIKERRQLRWLGKLLEDPYLLHLNRRSVSMGVGIGLFNAFLPLIGQMPLAAVMAIAFRGNLMISVILVWISNPLTMAPVLYWNYKLGNFLLGGWSHPVTSEIGLDWWLANFNNLMPPLLLGGITTGLIAGLAGHRITSIFWHFEVMNRWRNRQLKLKLRKPKNHS